MPTTDLTRLRKSYEKKQVNVSCAHIKFGDIVSTNIHQLFKLPKDALIIDAGVIVDTAANGAITVDFGFDGGTELGAAIPITTTGYKQVALATALTSGTVTAGVVANLAGTATKAPRILTGTGKTVTAVFSAGPTAGDFRFLVQYIEYKLSNGELTNYVA